MTTTTAILECRDLQRRFRRNQPVLEGLDLSVEPGDVVGLVGRNGAGKTTLMRLALGLLEPQRGQIRLFGLDPREEPVAVKRRLGYVAEDQVLPPHLHVDEVLDLHRHLYPTWDPQLEEELVRRFEVRPGARIRELSKGQARQVALLCAVAHRPELLLLDEPAGGLDPAVRREFLETAIRLLGESGTTILFSSHHMSDLERLACRIVFLHEGEILLDDDTDALREGVSLVRVAAAVGQGVARLHALPGCLAARERGDGLHAVVRGTPDEARRAVGEILGTPAAVATPLSLEELFIEIVGGRA